MTNSILKITDGDNSVNLLEVEDGYLVCDWKPAVAPWKGGGIWQSSPLSDGKRLSARNFDNAIETFNLTIKGDTQDSVINYIQRLVTLLEKATSYWTANWQREPVWIEARGATETNIRYAVIKGYTIDGLSNPFMQPFYGKSHSLMNEFTLVVERDHWLNLEPGLVGDDTSTVPVNNIQPCDDIYITNSSFSVAANTDNIQYSEVFDKDGNLLSEGADNTAWSLYIGEEYELDGFWYRARRYSVALRFPNVTINPGATVGDAFLEIIATEQDDSFYNLEFNIRGENVDNAPAINFPTSPPSYNMSRFYNSTNASAYLFEQGTHDGVGWPVAGTVVTWRSNIKDIIQEIIDRPGWVSGNAIALYIQLPPYGSFPGYHAGIDSYSLRYFAGNANPWADTPKLTIGVLNAGVNVSSAGSSISASEDIYITNKHIRAQLTHLYYYDLSAATYVNIRQEIADHGLPTKLLPTVPANGDIIYFGISNIIPSYGQFDNLVFYLTNFASADIVLTWEYPVTDDWVAVTTLPVQSDRNKNLTEGVSLMVYWEKPSDWVEAQVMGVTGWWVRARVTSTPDAFADPPIQGHENIYTCVTPFVDMDENDVKGELPALAKIFLTGVSTNESYTVAVGIRSKSRGDNYTPYLNFSTSQNASGISIGGVVPTSDYMSPNGESVKVLSDTITPDFVDLCSVQLNNIIAQEYRGTFHVYLRCCHKRTDGTFTYLPALGDVSIRLKFETPTINYSEEKYPLSTNGGLSLIDFGIFSFGDANTLTISDWVDHMAIYVQYKINTSYNDARNTSLNIYDIVMFPIDEWSGIYTTAKSGEGFNYPYSLILDSIGSPRSPRAIKVYSLSSRILSEWGRHSRGGPYLQANADQRLWFMFYGKDGDSFAFSNIKAKMRLHKTSRYLTMRGLI